MDESKKGQTTLEYLLIIVVALVVVLGVFIWASSTSDETTLRGDERVQEFSYTMAGYRLVSAGIATQYRRISGGDDRIRIHFNNGGSFSPKDCGTGSNNPDDCIEKLLVFTTGAFSGGEYALTAVDCSPTVYCELTLSGLEGGPNGGLDPRWRFQIYGK
ncbi:MAG: hypothetical protein JXB14_00095 [Candidatus Altiarchaeota archaeon]|nr:hypothetical protein [Candidatus Altiarchaeota archaeon]